MDSAEKLEKKISFLRNIGIENPESKTVISYVGRLEDMKVYTVLEEILKESSRDPDLLFLIGTDGTGDKLPSFINFLLNTNEGNKLIVSGRLKIVADLSKSG